MVNTELAGENVCINQRQKQRELIKHIWLKRNEVKVPQKNNDRRCGVQG